MASDFAQLFLDRKRKEQQPSRGMEITPAPSPYERYGVEGHMRGAASLESGEYTGTGENDVVEPTMPTERRIAVNGRPYAVDEGEVVVANAETVQAYGGAENLDRFIQMHRPDASGGMEQMNRGGIPGQQPAKQPGMRPYDSQFDILKDIHGGMPRMAFGGDVLSNLRSNIEGVGTAVQTAVDKQKVANATTVDNFSNNLTNSASNQTFDGPLGSSLSTGDVVINKPKQGDPFGVGAAYSSIQNNLASIKLPQMPGTPVTRPQRPSVDDPTVTRPQRPSVDAPVRMQNPAPLPTTTEQVAPVTAVRQPQQAAAPVNPAVSPSQLDEMVLDQYLSRMGGMSESDRAGEEQRLLQQGVGPEALRGQVAVSDVSRRSQLGDTAAQYATDQATRNLNQSNTNRAFNETRRANDLNESQNQFSNAVTRANMGDYTGASQVLTSAGLPSIDFSRMRAGDFQGVITGIDGLISGLGTDADPALLQFLGSVKASVLTKQWSALGLDPAAMTITGVDGKPISIADAFAAIDSGTETPATPTLLKLSDNIDSWWTDSMGAEVLKAQLEISPEGQAIMAAFDSGDPAAAGTLGSIIGAAFAQDNGYTLSEPQKALLTKYGLYDSGANPDTTTPETVAPKTKAISDQLALGTPAGTAEAQRLYDALSPEEKAIVGPLEALSSSARTGQIESIKGKISTGGFGNISPAELEAFALSPEGKSFIETVLETSPESIPQNLLKTSKALRDIVTAATTAKLGGTERVTSGEGGGQNYRYDEGFPREGNTYAVQGGVLYWVGPRQNNNRAFGYDQSTYQLTNMETGATSSYSVT